MSPTWKVRLNKAFAIAWAVAGIVAFPLGWAYSVAFVTIASIYANVKTDWGTAEAADDRAIHIKLDRIISLLEAQNNGNTK